MPDGNNAKSSGEQHQKPFVNPGKTVGVRSASPAKRSAADMEGDSQHVPGSFVNNSQTEGPTHFDQAMEESTMNGINRPVDEFMESQDDLPNSGAHTHHASTSTSTSGTNMTSTLPPPYSADEQPTQQTSELPSIDEQVQIVRQLTELHNKLDEGDRGYIISNKWINRVLSRSSDGLKESKYPKEAREGQVGPVDNSDIVPDGAFVEPILKDMSGQPFIPMRPSLSLDEDYQVLPYDAWGKIITWYGNTLHQKPILRYVHNTAPPEAPYPNLQYELDPPVITIRKIPQPHDDDETEESSAFSKSSVSELRRIQERRMRGQLSARDAVQLVSSKGERFNDFLKRAKEAAGIPRFHKVKVWKLTQHATSHENTQDTQPNGVLILSGSSEEQQTGVHAPKCPLVLDLETWNKLEGGKDFEPVDAKDETNNSNYNGRSTMSVYELYENATIALEEMIGGPGGGEYPSDSKKHGAKLAPSKRILGSKPGSAAPSGRTSPAPPTGAMLTRGRARRDGRTRGTVGLTNLGNTCYMNSALQCIRSVEELAIFFLSGKYKLQINANNPLGHKGAMAKRYAELLESMYSDSATGAITPNAFRKTLGSIQPMFSGYGQQDSQEFLSFLVDALHEDLNRIQKKPYNENPDSDDKTVHDPEAIIKLGEVYRANHRARNDSVAMDLFSGFYKNTMECPVCDKISITFDPYSLLTVQLPIESTFQHDVTFVPLRGRPVNHSIDIDKNASTKMLKEYIASQHPGVRADRLWMAEVYSHKIYKVFDDSITFGDAGIQPNDYIFMFELDTVPSNPAPPSEKRSNFSFSSNRADTIPGMDDAKADHFVVPVFSRQKHRSGNSWESILHPMYITVTREQAQDFETILKKVLLAVSQLTSKPVLTELHDSGEADKASHVEMKDGHAGEDTAIITEHSASSDDGYVEVSLDKPEELSKLTTHPNGDIEIEEEDRTRPIPKHFMDPQYFLSPDLRNNLFAINYGPSENGDLHCSGMQSFGTVRGMLERVKPSARRSSMQSSSSGEDSTTSTGSEIHPNGGETDGSDTDTFDRPDLILSETQESYLSLPPHASDDELPDNPLLPASRKGRRKQNKHGKKNKKLQTYGKKGQRGQRQKDSLGSPNSGQSHGRLFGKALQDEDDNPYFIKLGEGIVLDWYPQAVDQLFGGDAKSSDDERGHFVSSADGRNLPFARDAELEARRERRETRKKHGITLDDCFIETGKREVLSEDNAWYCNRCKELRRARKTLEIWTIPDILVVHLKRFGGNRSFRDKIDVFVDYPIEGLDMTERVGLKEDGKEYIYDLFAVDNHFGGLGGGHYTAFAKNFYDAQWYDYNDSSCSKINVENQTRNRLHSAAAYLLFYRRRSEQPLGPPELQELVLEARNPQANAEEVSDELDSGEGKLGGPTYSLLGSPSGLAGAGVDPANPHNGGSGSAGMAARASNSQITKTNPHHDHSIGVHQGSGGPIYGPQKPPAASQFGNQGSLWSFNTLNDTATESNHAAETLMNDVDGGIEDHDDTASIEANADTATDHFADSMEEDSNGLEDHSYPLSSPPGPTPAGSDDGMQDDQSMYGGGRNLDSLCLNDAGMTGSDIYPETPSLTDHDKMD